MSTVVVIKKDKQIVIGADSMTMYGSTKQTSEHIKNYSKIVRVGDSYLACVGHASFGLILNDFFSRQKELPKLHSPAEIFTIARKLHTALKDEYFIIQDLEDSDDDMESMRFDCLIANASGIYGLYRDRSVDEFIKFYAFGSGSSFALGAMRALYETSATAEEIARVAIETAAEFNDGTGLPAEIYTILC